MPLKATCDSCGKQVFKNLAKEITTITREGLSIEISVINFNNTSMPIICNNCVRKAVWFGIEEPENE